MDSIHLLIMYHDNEYGLALGKAISNLHNNIQTTLKYAGDSFEISHMKYHIILLEGFKQEELTDRFITSNYKDIIGKFILLLEDQVEYSSQNAPTPDANIFMIYKYKKVSSIVSDIYYFISMITGRKLFSKSNIQSKIVGFYSASGGTGKTAISIGVARELSRYHEKKVLILNFEELESFSFYLKEDLSKRSIGDYLYYLFQKSEENRYYNIEGFTQTDEYGIETFRHLNKYNELKKLNKDEIEYLIKTINEYNRYDYILLDLENDLTDETLSLLNYCSKVVFVDDTERMSDYKHNKLFNYLKKTAVIDIDQKLIRVKNKVNLADDTEQIKDYKDFDIEENNQIIKIEKDYASFQLANDHIEININKLFGIGIKKIVDEILNDVVNCR